MRVTGDTKIRIAKSSTPCARTGCWLWQKAPRNRKVRYGSMWYKGKTHYAHRVSFLVYNGEIKPGTEVMHSCDRPTCVNPKHLRLGSHAKNMGDYAKRRKVN